MKHYIAFWDNGHDCGEFEFYSEHRANSKKNIRDAFVEARKKYYKQHARAMKITHTQLCQWD